MQRPLDNGPEEVFHLMSLEFEITDVRDLTSVERVWRDLETRADASVFQSWEWIGSWAGLVKSESLLLLTGRAGRVTVLLGLVVPSIRRDVRIWSTPGIRLHTTGHEGQDVITIEYNGFLVDRNWAETAETQAITFLTSGISLAGVRRDELHLRGVADSYEKLKPPGVMTTMISRRPSWRIDLDSVRESGRPYLDHLSANTRQQIRRSIRLYEKRGKLEASWAKDVPEAMRFLGGLKELHQQYWNARGEPGGFAYPFFEKFVRRLIEHCVPHGTVELVRVSCGADPIGYVFNLQFRGHIYAYQTGLLYEDDPKLKPGLVSHYLCIEQHLREGARVYDFMAGDARYKANLGQPGPDMVYMLVARPTIALKVENALRDLKHRIDHWRGHDQPPPAPRPAHPRSPNPEHPQPPASVETPSPRREAAE